MLVRSLIIILFFFVTSISSAPVLAWILPEGVDQSMINLKIPAVHNALNYVSLQFWVPNNLNVKYSKYAISNGGDQFDDATIAEIRDTCRAHGIKTMLSVYNNTEADGSSVWCDGLYSLWDWALVKNSIESYKTSFIQSLIDEMNRHDLDGLHINFLGPLEASSYEKQSFVNFIKLLSSAVQAEDKELIVSAFHNHDTPGISEWDKLTPYVDGLVSSGFSQTGISASGGNTYATQKAYADPAQEKLMFGMPSDINEWWGNTVQEQVNWLVEDSVVGLAISDLRLLNPFWASYRPLWNSIASIRGPLPTHPEGKINSGANKFSTERKPSFTWEGYDYDGDVVGYYYSIDNPTPNIATTDTFYTVASDLSFGEHTFYMQVKDNDGNLSIVEEWSFIVSDGTPGPNIISNGDFADGSTDWSFVTHQDFSAYGSGKVENEEYIMQMLTTGTKLYHGNVSQGGILLENGKGYEVSFDAKASEAALLSWSLQQNGGSWQDYMSDVVSLTTTMNTYTFRVIMEYPTDSDALFQLGIGTHKAAVTVDNISVRELPASDIFTITTIVPAGDSIIPVGPVEVRDGFDQTFTITETDNFLTPLVDVLVDGVSQGAIREYTFVNVKSNHSIEAVYGEKPSFTIAASVEGTGGSITPSGDVKVTIGENQSFSIELIEGATFDSLYIDGAKVDTVSAYTFHVVAEDHSITAYTSSDDVGVIDFKKETSSKFAVVNNLWTIGSTNTPTIKWGDANRYRFVELALFDLLGNKLMSRKLKGPLLIETALNLNGVVKASGTYLLVIRAHREDGSVDGARIVIGAQL